MPRLVGLSEGTVDTSFADRPHSKSVWAPTSHGTTDSLQLFEPQFFLGYKDIFPSSSLHLRRFSILPYCRVVKPKEMVHETRRGIFISKDLGKYA